MFVFLCIVNADDDDVLMMMMRDVCIRNCLRHLRYVVFFGFRTKETGSTKMTEIP